jgi:aerobic carbon-monoxide dehydrogenase medium subunit
MITQEFEFRAPREIGDVLRLLAERPDDKKLLAGGMSLVPMMTLGLVRPLMVISLNHISGFDYVREDGEYLRIGAGTTHAAIARDPIVARHCPTLAEAARYIGDVQVRNRGTIGGSAVHADPAADYLPVMAAAGARMMVQNLRGRREVPARDFFTGLMQTAVAPDEVLAEVAIPKSRTQASYQRLHRIEGNFAIVNAAAVVDSAHGTTRIAVGGVGPAPLMLDVSAELRGGPTAEALEAVAARVYGASTEAPEDLNASPEYRRRMAALYARRAIEAAYATPPRGEAGG